MRLHKKYGSNPTMPVCFFCGKEKGEIVLLGAAYKEKAPRLMIVDKAPCEKCKELMKKGVMLASVRDGECGNNPYRTGKIAVIRENAARKIFGNYIKGKRFAFVEDTVWKTLGLGGDSLETKDST